MFVLTISPLKNVRWKKNHIFLISNVKLPKKIKHFRVHFFEKFEQDPAKNQDFVSNE